tara:strand:- start:5651 stop:6721 length:1071 start_codon:yes stop_codon:yes gene_type:complete
MDKKTISTIALTLIILQGILGYNLYINNNYNGSKLGVIDTLKNIIGLLEIVKDKVDDTIDDVKETAENTIDVVKETVEDTAEIISENIIDPISENIVQPLFDKISNDDDDNELDNNKSDENNENNENNTKNEENNSKKSKSKSKKKEKKKLTRFTDEKEVFNIDRNDFTYEEAGLVCQAFDAKLATFDQIVKAHKGDKDKKGAHWCNYGWSENQMALYPTQENIWKKIQKGPEEEKNKCGNPGVNGGYFKNKDLKFGVNCYGYRPKPDPGKILYSTNFDDDNELDSKSIELLNKYKSDIEKGDLSIRPYNNNYWSKYSFKKSKYIINPNCNSTIDPVILEVPVSDDNKNPNLYITK